MVNKEGKELNIIERWKLYWEISEVSAIARRYFTMNFTDGLLTTLGIIIGIFVLYIRDPSEYLTTDILILPGIATAIAMGVSGISGSILSEEAERAKIDYDLKKAMVLYEEEKDLKNNISDLNNLNQVKEEILKHMIGLSRKAKERYIKKHVKVDSNENYHNKAKDINKKAENFATYTLSIVNGLSSFLGALLMLIPFFVVHNLNIFQFIISFIIIIVTTFLLARYLAKLSKESIIKYFSNFLLAIILTIFLTLTIGQFT
jgi:VIT1/CCC1 family predicted Fe2+/Mn2+ transporter